MGFENMNLDKNENEGIVDADDLHLRRQEILDDAEASVEIASALKGMKSSEPTPLESAKHALMEKIAAIMHRSSPLYELMRKDIEVFFEKIEKNEATPSDVLEFGARFEPEDRRPFTDFAKVLEDELESSGTVQ
jgi:hypothetical protein